MELREVIPCKQTDIDAAEQLLLEEFNKKFPNGWYTTFVTKWNDGTFKIEVRHGEPMVLNQPTHQLHHFVWDDGKIEYSQSTIPTQFGVS